MRCGSTFLLYDDDQNDGKPHLHIVISDADENDNVVLVSVTTERAKSDTMVRLAAGDHPFIEHPSVITYAYSKVMTCAQIRGLEASGDARAKEQASDRLVERAQFGMLETDRAPEEVQECFRWWWNQRK
jgi:mRNA-degrading endonuclease toxin of MazEF toxin-antitoxin module